MQRCNDQHFPRANPHHARYGPLMLRCLKKHVAFGYCIALLASTLSAAQLVVPVPQGETWLQDVGTYRVVWQSYGQQPIEMPISWAGHFDPKTGISYMPAGTVLGRRALLMHSPWRVPPGKTWVDYQLSLPAEMASRLAFGIAMGSEAVGPGKSDGVTFSCYLQEGATDKELLRRHYDKAEWADYSFDLSAYAGKTIRIRLQVEPGPQNNASFDFSYFGDAKIIAGSATPDRKAMLSHLTGTPAYRAVEKASRIALSNVSTNGVAPSNLLPFDNRIERKETTWEFTYRGADCRIVYTLKPQTGTLDDFSVQVDDQAPFQPAFGGGVTGALKHNGHEETIPGLV